MASADDTAICDASRKERRLTMDLNPNPLRTDKPPFGPFGPALLVILIVAAGYIFGSGY